MIAGIDIDFSGSITIDGVAAALAPTPGFVFQDPRLLPWLTAEQNIRAVDARCTRAEAGKALELVGLGGSSMLYPHQLSGGMQRRVALARALVVPAGLLLLDEPFVSLDRTLVAEIHDVFLRIVDEARPTVVFVSHLTDDAARLADRAIILDGRPAAVVAEIAMPIPAAQRNAATLAEYRLALDSYFQGPRT